MCLVLLSWKTRPDYRLVIAANRDEFYERPTRKVHWWDEHPQMLAGMDLKAGGTWIGVTKSGKFAAITNYREFPITKHYKTSRGSVVKDYLTGDWTPESYLKYLEENGNNYDGFNLVFGSFAKLFYYSNRSDENGRLDSGIYGLSNHLLDTPWPKVIMGKLAINSQLQFEKQTPEAYFKILENRQKADERKLPDTGIGLKKERILSPMFIDSPGYGTRSSYVLMIGTDGSVHFTEKGHVPHSSGKFSFKITGK